MTQTPQPAQTADGSQGTKFWDDILSIGIRRDRSRQWFGGVCSGIARRADVDPVLIRAAMIALTLLGGFGIVVYLVGWLLLPDETGRIMARDAINRDGGDAGGAIALSVIALIVIAAIIFGDNGFFIGWGVVPLAIIGWFVWRHQQRKIGAQASPWVSADTSQPSTMYAASSAPASYAPTAPTAPTAPVASGPVASGPIASGAAAGDGSDAWQPPPAPPVPPRAHLPLAPPPPPRPRRRSAGFAGFALVLGAAIVGYGAGLMLDDPLNFSGSAELLGGVIGLAAASLATLVIGLLGRRSLLSVALVMILGLGTAVAGVGEETWNSGQGTRTWVPSLSSTETRYELGAGETTLDLRPLADQLAAPAPTPEVAPTPSAPSPGATASPVPTPSSAPTAPTAPAATTPQQIEVYQGAGEMRIIVPEGANAQINAQSTFGDVQVRGDLPGGVSERDRGNEDGPSERLTVNVGSGAPTIVVNATMRFGQITIQEG